MPTAAKVAPATPPRSSASMPAKTYSEGTLHFKAYLESKVDDIRFGIAKQVLVDGGIACASNQAALDIFARTHARMSVAMEDLCRYDERKVNEAINAFINKFCEIKLSVAEAKGTDIGESNVLVLCARLCRMMHDNAEAGEFDYHGPAHGMEIFLDGMSSEEGYTDLVVQLSRLFHDGVVSHRVENGKIIKGARCQDEENSAYALCDELEPILSELTSEQADIIRRLIFAHIVTTVPDYIPKEQRLKTPISFMDQIFEVAGLFGLVESRVYRKLKVTEERTSDLDTGRTNLPELFIGLIDIDSLQEPLKDIFIRIRAVSSARGDAEVVTNNIVQTFVRRLIQNLCNVFENNANLYKLAHSTEEDRGSILSSDFTAIRKTFIDALNSEFNFAQVMSNNCDDEAKRHGDLRGNTWLQYRVAVLQVIREQIEGCSTPYGLLQWLNALIEVRSLRDGDSITPGDLMGLVEANFQKMSTVPVAAGCCCFFGGSGDAGDKNAARYKLAGLGLSSRGSSLCLRSDVPPGEALGWNAALVKQEIESTLASSEGDTSGSPQTTPEKKSSATSDEKVSPVPPPDFGGSRPVSDLKVEEFPDPVMVPQALS